MTPVEFSNHPCVEQMETWLCYMAKTISRDLSFHCRKMLLTRGPHFLGGASGASS